MWCDPGKSVWNRICDIFSFLFDWCVHLERYILLKTPPESVQWYQSYEHLKGSQNNRKQKKSIPFSGCISQSIHPTSKFRLIPLDCNTYSHTSEISTLWWIYESSFKCKTNCINFLFWAKFQKYQHFITEFGA